MPLYVPNPLPGSTLQEGPDTGAGMQYVVLEGRLYTRQRYDEFFEGWGSEDSDFACRMMNSGVARLYLKFSGIAYHL
jgi:hypothetical protein